MRKLNHLIPLLLIPIFTGCSNGDQSPWEFTDFYKPVENPVLPNGTYSVGMVVFDRSDPEKVIYRTDSCLLKPTLPNEVSGQYSSGTTFAEGLVLFDSKWYMYYGTADSFIGVAVSE